MQRGLFFAVIGVVVVAVVAFLLLRPQGNGASNASSADPAAGARFVIGSPDAPVTVVEFFNYLCPHCSDHALNEMPLIKSNYIDAGKVRYVFRDFPFPGQANVIRAGEAAACAHDAANYLPYHDALFRSQQVWFRLSGDSLDAYLVDLATQLGLAPGPFQDCLKSGSKEAGVIADRDAASALGLTGTPSFIINGVTLPNRKSYAEWQELLDKALAGESIDPAANEGDGPSTPANGN